MPPVQTFTHCGVGRRRIVADEGVIATADGSVQRAVATDDRCRNPAGRHVAIGQLRDRVDRELARPEFALGSGEKCGVPERGLGTVGRRVVSGASRQHAQNREGIANWGEAQSPGGHGSSLRL